MPRHIADLIAARITRRTLLEGMGGAAAVSAAGCGPKILSASPAEPFLEVKTGFDGRAHWPTDTHDCQVVISWGDPLFARSPDWQPGAVTALAQAQQFGDCNDFIAFMPLPRGGRSSTHGLLVVNHEFTNRPSMFPENPKPTYTWVAEPELMAHGMSVVEVHRLSDGWEYRRGGDYARRISPRTEIALTGPVAGHPRLQTAADPTGRAVLGTVANCSGGVTPWHTVLSGEENIHLYFRGVPEDTGAEAENCISMGVGVICPWRFDMLDDRWILAKTPTEPNRFGWIVELDPYDARHIPRKRTALGRFAHEGAEVIVDPSGHIVVMMGDDTVNEFVYRYVSEGRWDPAKPESADRLLDKGTLSVGRFDESGVTWVPLEHKGALAEAFPTEGDMLIETRRAARIMGATPMDRPERLSVHPINGEVYVMLAKNPQRTVVGPAAPRTKNMFGQVLILVPPAGDYVADRWTWRLLLEAGPPDTCVAVPPPSITTDDGLLCCPDNCCFDSAGRLWVTTDGMTTALRRSGLPARSDGMFLVDIDGPTPGRSRLFFRAPVGAELTGPCFTPDDQTLFLSVQHPGRKPFRGAPTSCWPAAEGSGLPPRSSVVALTRRGGGKLI